MGSNRCIYVFLLIFSQYISGRESYKSSLTYVIDGTRSMANDIDEVKLGANAIFDTVLNNNASQIDNFIIVTFNDHGNGNKGVRFLADTRDRDEFRNALSAIEVNGGGDCPEYSMAGIKEALERSLPRSQLYVFTDASAKDYEDYEEVKSLAQRKQSQVIFALTGECGTTSSPDYQVYRSMADATDGEVFRLTKPEVGRILEYVKKSVKGRKTTLAREKIPAGEHNITFDADTIMGEITLSLSSLEADNPLVDVFAPDGSKVWNKILFETSQIKVYSMDVTMPGVHTVNIKSRKESRAKVAAISGIDYEHGFSAVPIPTIVDTSSRPAPGVKSHLSIKLNEGDVELKRVKILSMDDKVLMEMPLKLINTKTKFYSTEAFNPPKTMFKIMIVACDPESDTCIKRTSSPVETQKLPPGEKIVKKSPTVSIEGDTTVTALYNEPLQILCRVTGYPQPTVAWTNLSNGTDLTGETSALDLPYDYISSLNITKVQENATFACKAYNTLGSSEKQVTVITSIPRKFNVEHSPKVIELQYGKDGKIECLVDAYPPAKITWYKKGMKLSSGGNIEMSSNMSVLTIKNVTLSDKGKYACRVDNGDRRALIYNYVRVGGFESPQIDTSTPTNVVVRRYYSATLQCKILLGKPKPTIRWYRIPAKAIDSYERTEMEAWKDKETVKVVRTNPLDAALYVCEARNEISTDSRQINLTVEYPPSIKNDVKEISAKVATEVVIRCDAAGGPDPNVTWYKDNVELVRSYRINIYSDHTLKFVAQPSDIGIYTCVARNKFSAVAKTVKVHINVPVYISPPLQSYYAVIKGDKLRLLCKALGDPKPDIKWIYRSFNTSSPVTKTLMPTTDEELQLENMQVSDEGYYTCVASNAGGSTNITYTVLVYSSPTINKKHFEERYIAVAGDRGLRLTCEATGNPKPEITWIKDGLTLASGDYYHVDGGMLIIKNVPKNARGDYWCHAENDIGDDDDRFTVIVHDYPQSSGVPTTSVMVEIGKPAEIQCNIPHKPVDQLRWFKNEKLIKEGEFTISEVSIEHFGTYTCRVNDFFKSETARVRLNVGDGPTFVTDEEENVDMNEGVILKCNSIGNPMPEVHWYRDGNRLDSTNFELYLSEGIHGPGRYTCEVKNSFRTISRTFTVTPRDCYIDLTKLTKRQPLMLTTGLDWPLYEKSNELIVFPRGQQLVLFCPKAFETIPKPYVSAMCDEGNNFIIFGEKYNYSAIQCTEEVNHVVQKTGERCMPGTNSERLIIGYNELQKIKNKAVFEICWDKRNLIPIYAKHVMQSAVDEKVDFPWLDSKDFEMDFKEAYNCKEQIDTISYRLKRYFHKDDECCFAKRQLVNPKDVFPGVPQKATFSYYNVVPQWSSCNTQNWDEVEQRVRNFVMNSMTDLLVWTGTAEHVTLNSSAGVLVNDFFRDLSEKGQKVPRYLWKVIQHEESSSSLAIIQVNVPDLIPSEIYKFIRCRDVCDRVEWMRNPTWHDLNRGYTYCCYINEFAHKFGFSGIFKPEMTRLLNYEPEHYVLSGSDLVI